MKKLDIEDVEPCPFCDSKDLRCKRLSRSKLLVIVCVCGAMGPPSKFTRDVIDAWNERHSKYKDKIEPRPFCSSEATTFEDTNIPDYVAPIFQVQCLGCGISTPKFSSPERAIGLWNTRPRERQK